MSKLWILTQDEEDGYDTYDSVVVVADTEQDAKMITPDRWDRRHYLSWASSPDLVKAKYLGEADAYLQAGEIVLASFNAG